jgi:outer membrane protein assembly factor BamB
MKLPRQIIFVFCACFGAALAGFAQPVTNLWSLQLSKTDSDSSPALAPDGTIYQGTFDGKLFAVTPQGEIKWTFQAGREIQSSPAVGDGGTIYFGSRDRKFYALAPDGKLKWTFATGAWIDSSPAIATDGAIYFGSWDGNFYALNPNGSLKWKFLAEGIVDSSPAIGADGTIYFGSHDKKFYALAPDGKLRWQFATQGQIISSPAINSDGTIIFTSNDGNLYALNNDGSEKWHLHTGGFTRSSPVLDKDGDIFVMVKECLFSFTSAGTKKWAWCSALDNDDSVAIAADGLIYFPRPWRTLTAMKPDGGEQWEMSLPVNVSSSPVIGKDGVIYMAAGRFLYAINSPNGLAPLAKSSWPMWRADPQHTGRVQNVK